MTFSTGGIAFLASIAIFSIWRFFIFFRNPPRKIPQQDDIIVSPADGRICYIKTVKNAEIPISLKKNTAIRLDEYSGLMAEESTQEYWLVGIYMSIIDVHYNRAPIAGTIKMMKRFIPAKNQSMTGVFINLLMNRTPMDQNSEFLLTNERCSTWIEGKKISVGLIQIADKWISDIIPSIAKAQFVSQGEVVGLIRMGSQVDLLIPKTATLNCSMRQKVKAGETILAQY